jgi:hypothetical protein
MLPLTLNTYQFFNELISLNSFYNDKFPMSTISLYSFYIKTKKLYKDIVWFNQYLLNLTLLPLLLLLECFLHKVSQLFSSYDILR